MGRVFDQRFKDEKRIEGAHRWWNQQGQIQWTAEQSILIVPLIYYAKQGLHIGNEIFSNWEAKKFRMNYELLRF